MPRRIEISHRTVIFILAVLALLWLILQIRDILLLLFVSVILAAALYSPVEWLCQRKVPRPLAAFLVYIFIFFFFGSVIGLLIPPLIEQTNKLVTSLPALLENTNRFFLYQFPIQDLLKSFGGQLSSWGGNLFRFTIGIFSNLISLLMVFVINFYLLLRWKKLGESLGKAFGPQHEKRILRLFHQVESGLGGWLRGQLFLCFAVGTLSFIGLSLLKVPYALHLALIAGILEIFPIIGPIISSIPAILSALIVSPLLALATAALYIVVQQLENNLIVPKVMQKAVGVDPLVTILALMIGVKLMGVPGAILAVPAVVLLKIIFLEILRPQESEKT